MLRRNLMSASALDPRVAATNRFGSTAACRIVLFMIRNLFVNMPTIAFLLLFHLDDERLGAAFIGMLLAWVVVLSKQRQPIIVRGLNLHFALIVPLLFVAWRFGLVSFANWIETWVLASVVWAAAGAVVHAVWRGALPGVMGLVAGIAVGWTLILPNDQLLTIGVPVIAMSFATRWLGRGDANALIFATSVTTGADDYL